MSGNMENKVPLILSFAGPEPDAELLEWTEAGMLAGIVLFKNNFSSIARLKRAIAGLRAASPHRLRVMIDEEGGRVRRLPPDISPMPSIAEYGRQDGAGRVAADYAALCHTLAGLGVDTLLAPVGDVRGQRNEWLADRTFSDDPVKVADFVRQSVLAIQQKRLSACVKHFPGLAGVQNDLHQHPFVVEDSVRELERRDLPPFQAAIGAGVEMIMVSHAVYTGFDSTRPAVFSPVVIGDILRRRLGFAGTVLSDDLVMRAVTGQMPIEKAIEQALWAGCDLILICNDRALQRRAVQFITRQGGDL